MSGTQYVPAQYVFLIVIFLKYGIPSRYYLLSNNLFVLNAINLMYGNSLRI